MSILLIVILSTERLIMGYPFNFTFSDDIKFEKIKINSSHHNNNIILQFNCVLDK